MAQTSFRQQLKSGFIYTALAKYLGIVISLGVTAILSRLLTPDDFGVIAIATVFIVFFSIFSDMGLSSAIVQKKNLTEEDIRSLYSSTIYLGIFLAVGFFFSSRVIGSVYANQQLIPICRLLALNILFVTWNIVPNGILFREKLFRFIGIRSIVIQLILAIISIMAAFLGAGVYALLINPIGNACLMYVISYAKNPVGFTIIPKFIAIKKIASYSSYTFGFSLINYFTRNLDKLMVGKVFGMDALGYYEKSYRLMLLPVQNLTHVITPVLHPILSDYQYDLEVQSTKYFKLIELLALIGFPISVFLYFSADSLIILIFGTQWIPSIPVFRILSLSVGIQITGSTLGAFFQASNRTKQLFYLGGINTIVNVVGLLIGVYVLKSIEGVAWMWVLTMYLGLWNLVYLARQIGWSLQKVLKPYYLSLLPTVVLLVCLFVFDYKIESYLILKLIVNALFSGLIILFALNYYKLFDIKGYFKRKFHNR